MLRFRWLFSIIASMMHVLLCVSNQIGYCRYQHGQEYKAESQKARPNAARQHIKAFEQIPVII